MIQICRKDREKVYKAIRTGKIDAAEVVFGTRRLMTWNRVERCLRTLPASMNNFQIYKNLDEGINIQGNLCQS